MKHTLKFIIKVLMLVSVPALAQEQAADTVAAASPEKYGLRVGADISRLARTFYEDDFKGIELVADYRLSKKYYAAAELGNVDITVDDAQLNFTTKGSYIKLGVDYNAYENWLDMQNMIFAGVRYGFSTFNHNLNSYRIYDRSGYFDEVVISPDQEFNGLTAHWAEIVGGVKAEIFSNLYLGFSVRLNFLITEKEPAGFENLYIPGFNRTYSGSFGTGFNYSLSYMIPLFRKGR